MNETLQYIRLEPLGGATSIVTQFTGGGAAVTIRAEASPHEVSYELEKLARRIRDGAEQRRTGT